MGVTQVTATKDITEYHLANGVKVLLFPNTSKPTVLVNITYVVGSGHDNYGETGMAHLLEQMLFKGTPQPPNTPQEFSRRGTSVNGSIDIDRMVNSFVARKDLDREMTVVRNEFENGENSSFAVMNKRMQSVVCDWHNYGNSPIGNRSDIENLRIKNLQGFYRTYYQPDNVVLQVAGKFDPSRALPRIIGTFGSIAEPQRQLPFTGRWSPAKTASVVWSCGARVRCSLSRWPTPFRDLCTQRIQR